MTTQKAAGFSGGLQISLAEWANLHTHLIWIYDGLADPRGQGDVLAPDMTAWMLRSGKVKIVADGKQWSATAGQWFFPPQGIRSQNFSANTHIVSVRFRARWPTGEDFFQSGLGLAVDADDHPELLKAAMPLVRLVSENFPTTTVDLMQEPTDLVLHTRLQTLYATWFETVVRVFLEHGVEPKLMGKMDPRLLRAVLRLDKQPLSQPLSEGELALTAQLSVSQMNRLFRQRFGVSSRGYYERRRHEYALAALQGTSATVKEIAYRLGFSSLPHFSTWFRKKHGFSPTQFRNQDSLLNRPAIK